MNMTGCILSEKSTLIIIQLHDTNTTRTAIVYLWHIIHPSLFMLGCIGYVKVYG